MIYPELKLSIERCVIKGTCSFGMSVTKEYPLLLISMLNIDGVELQLHRLH